MDEKKPWYKKVLGVLGVVVAAILGIFVGGRRRRGLENSDRELSELNAQLAASRRELEQVRIEQNRAAEASRDLEESLRLQSAVADDVANQLESDRNLYRQAESQLRQARAATETACKILAKYSKGVEGD